MKKKGGRKCVVKVMVTAYEKARIAGNAKACGMSMSGLARTLLTAHTPVYRNDPGDMKEVFKLHADLGRLGGLLKMLLTNDERLNDMGRDMALVTIDGVLVDLRKTQSLLKDAVAEYLGRSRSADGDE